MHTQALLPSAVGWCGRMPDSASRPKSCQSTGEVASQALLLSQPFRWCWRLLICSPACLCSCLTHHQGRTTPRHDDARQEFVIYGAPELCRPATMVPRPSPCCSAQGCPGAARADRSQQPGPEGDANKDSKSVCCDQTPLSPPWSLSPKRSPCAAAPPPFSRGPPWRPGARRSAHSGGSKGGRRALVTSWGSLEDPPL